MQKVFASSNLIEITAIQSLIEREGIHTLIRNEHLGTMLPLGDLTEIELWVRDAARADEGRAIARRYLDQTNDGAEGEQSWQCGTCRELNPGNFAVCWQCGAEGSGVAG